MVTGIGTRDCETVQKGTKSWQGSATQQVQVMEKEKEPNAQSHRSFFFFFSLGSTAGAAHLNDRTVAPKFFIASLHTHTHTPWRACRVPRLEEFPERSKSSLFSGFSQPIRSLVSELAYQKPEDASFKSSRLFSRPIRSWYFRSDRR